MYLYNKMKANKCNSDSDSDSYKLAGLTCCSAHVVVVPPQVGGRKPRHRGHLLPVHRLRRMHESPETHRDFLQSFGRHGPGVTPLPQSGAPRTSVGRALFPLPFSCKSDRVMDHLRHRALQAAGMERTRTGLGNRGAASALYIRESF